MRRALGWIRLKGPMRLALVAMVRKRGHSLMELFSLGRPVKAGPIEAMTLADRGGGTGHRSGKCWQGACRRGSGGVGGEAANGDEGVGGRQGMDRGCAKKAGAAGPSVGFKRGD
jgi:hypothetical protein